MAATTYPNYSPGLEGVIAGISKICDIDSDKSLLIYRGYNVQDLAEYGSFEETAYLLLHGDLPTAAQLETFKETLRGERGVPSEIYTVLRAMPRDTHPMDLAKVAFAALAPHDPDYTNGDHDANVRKATRIVAKAPTLVAAAHRIRTGKDPIEPSSSLGHAANFLYMMEGSEPDDYTAKVMDASLTLYAEHG
ncbi:MAG TPA: citrate/2-methylcitrate synthase, partial [Fimbriimonadaceae bacterium]|nr:citrate/2-methylcitrate synthase [Fimbriimonadaceae bacterium]